LFGMVIASFNSGTAAFLRKNYLAKPQSAPRQSIH